MLKREREMKVSHAQIDYSPIDAIARIIDVANKMGDGKSIGYDVVVSAAAVAPLLLIAFSPTSLSVMSVVVVVATTSSFANRCEDGSGGNPTTSSLSSVLLAHNTVRILLVAKIAIDLADGNLIVVDVDAVVIVAVGFIMTMEVVVENAATDVMPSDDSSIIRTIIADIGDAAMVDFMIALLDTPTTATVFMVMVVNTNTIMCLAVRRDGRQAALVGVGGKFASTCKNFFRDTCPTVFLPAPPYKDIFGDFK